MYLYKIYVFMLRRMQRVRPYWVRAVSGPGVNGIAWLSSIVFAVMKRML